MGEGAPSLWRSCHRITHAIRLSFQLTIRPCATCAALYSWLAEPRSGPERASHLPRTVSEKVARRLIGSMRACAASRADLAGKQQRHRGDHQHHADDREGIGEAQDEGLALYGVADGNDRLGLGDRRIGDAVGEE